MKRIAFLSVLLLFQMMIVAQTAEECYQKGKNYYEGKNGVQKDYAEAYKWLKKAADQGHADGTNGLGMLYEDGLGVAKDYNEALKLYQKAAELGSAKAMNNIGLLYEYGRGVTKDYNEAFKWYLKAAEHGNLAAQCNLGTFYQQGLGTTMNYSEAVKWFRKAAEQGHARSQSCLGYMYANGYGVTKDYAEAAKWYRKSAEQGYARGQNNLGELYRDSKGVSKDYNEALRWFRKAAEQNYASSQANLGYMYEYGYGVDQDYNEAQKWYRKAAEQNHVWSQNKMGDLHYEGKGQEKDYAEAAKWYRKAAENGNSSAQYSLGGMYCNGEGVDKDYSEAVVWYQKAANNGNRGAKNSLGWMYENGYGVTKDLAQAVKLYREAADMGSSSAQRNMGIVYEKGIGVEQDYNEAEKWFKKALETDPDYQKVKDDLARLEKKKSGSTRDDESKEEKLFNKGMDYFFGRNGVGQDYAQALSYLRQAAEMGMSDAQHNVGVCYQNGLGVTQNYPEAVKWYKMSAEQNDEKSFATLGSIYQHGYSGVPRNETEAEKWYLRIVNNSKSSLEPTMFADIQNNLGSIYFKQKNYAEALKWYRKAAEQGRPNAQYNLGVMYNEGWGVVKDEIEATKWFMKAANQGHVMAQYNLGCQYRDGNGVKQNFIESNKWYLKAANQGDAEAQTSIGISYLRGRGDFERNYEKAMGWFQKAAAQGNENAMNNIGSLYMNGDGVTRNLDKAEEWYQKALKANPDSEDAKENLRILERKRKSGTATFVVTVDPFSKDKDTQNASSKKTTLLPAIEFVDNSFSFEDPTGTNAIIAGGKYKIKFQVLNSGKGTAKDCQVKVDTEGNKRGISVGEFTINALKPGETKNIEVLVTAGTEISNGQVEFCISVEEPNGMGTGEKYIIVNTRGIDEPMVRITDYSLTAASGKVLKKKEPFDLQLILQNIDLGQADDISIELELPEKVLMLDGKESESFPKLEGGEAKSLVYSLIVRNDYTESIIPITVHLKEKTGKYAQDRTISLTLDQSFASTKLSTKNYRDGMGFDMATSTSDVDKDIPTTKHTQEKTFALIIANENYEEVDPVPYAANDGTIFKTYCQQALGIPEDNIHIISDATLGKMRRQVEWLQEVMEAYQNEARIIFYYAGHGIPDEKSKTAYLLPVDGFGRDVKTGYALDELYSALAKLPSKSVTVFLDACFSGAKREGNMLTSARGIAIKVKQNAPEGNLVIFSAAQGDETAYPYDDQQHGMFTYYLLKKLKESDNSLTLGELADYVKQQVMQESLKKNGKLQTPTIVSSTMLSNSWKEMKIK